MKIFDRGDVNENRHFIEGKWVAHYQKFKNCEKNINNFENFHKFFNGGDVNKKSSFYWRKMSRTLPKTLKIVRKCLLKWLRKCVVNVFLLEMRDRGDLTEEWAMIPVTKKHEHILPEFQLVTKKHRCFFDVFSWQTENGGDVTKNSDFLFRENGRAWSVFYL